MAEAATSESSPPDTTAKETAVDASMVESLERTIDRYLAADEFPSEFAVPGENRLSATLDVARTVVRRAERIAVAGALTSAVASAYLNRLSDLCWALARSVERVHRTNHREPKQRS